MLAISQKVRRKSGLVVDRFNIGMHVVPKKYCLKTFQKYFNTF